MIWQKHTLREHSGAERVSGEELKQVKKEKFYGKHTSNILEIIFDLFWAWRWIQIAALTHTPVFIWQKFYLPHFPYRTFTRFPNNQTTTIVIIVILPFIWIRFVCVCLRIFHYFALTLSSRFPSHHSHFSVFISLFIFSHSHIQIILIYRESLIPLRIQRVSAIIIMTTLATQYSIKF